MKLLKLKVILFILLNLFITSSVFADYNYTRLLRYGKRGYDVRELQKCLNRLGYNTGKADGIFGRNTAYGVRLFQRSRGLIDDAIIGRKTGPQFTLACTTQNKIKLLPPKNGEIYFSAFPDFGGSEDFVTKEKVEDFEELAEKDITWAMFSQNWYRGITFPREHVNEIRKAGAVPLVRIMARSNEDRYGENGTFSEENFSLQKIIDGDFDEALKKYAREVKNDGKPILFDFNVEANGDWFLWSGKHNGAGKTNAYGNKKYPDGPERWRDAYRHIIDIFRSEGVNNATWFFHVDINSVPDEWWNKPRYYYPGDDYIDWIGISAYGPQNDGEEYWELFSDMLEEKYKDILAVSSKKPFALMEFGVTDGSDYGDKSEWLEDVFETVLNKKYIPFSAISYWHEDWEEEDGSEAHIRIDSSRKALRTFQRLLNNRKFISTARFTNNLFEKEVSVEKQKIKSNEMVIFRSGFENGVFLKKPVADEGGIWWQEIKGSDMGYSWPINVNGKGTLQLIVDADKDIRKYISNTIERVRDKNGNWTNALHQNILKKQHGDTQDPYIIYTDGKEAEDLHIQYSMKLPKNTKELLGKDGWMALTEFKTTGDYRLAFYIYEDSEGELSWYVHGDNVVDEPDDYEEFWYRENHDVDVPIDKWFDVDLSWHRSKNDDGRVLWAINGETIVDYHGKTKIDDPINAIMVFTNYASGPMHQWIDNIKISKQL
jgi:beta-mannanase